VTPFFLPFMGWRRTVFIEYIRLELFLLILLLCRLLFVFLWTLRNSPILSFFFSAMVEECIVCFFVLSPPLNELLENVSDPQVVASFFGCGIEDRRFGGTFFF